MSFVNYSNPESHAENENYWNITLISVCLCIFQVHHYVLTITATDAGPNPLTGTVTVYMNVLDINDNAPVFDPSSYSDEVWENATMGTSILTVSATDTDSGMYP